MQTALRTGLVHAAQAAPGNSARGVRGGASSRAHGGSRGLSFARHWRWCVLDRCAPSRRGLLAGDQKRQHHVAGRVGSIRHRAHRVVSECEHLLVMRRAAIVVLAQKEAARAQEATRTRRAPMRLRCSSLACSSRSASRNGIDAGGSSRPHPDAARFSLQQRRSTRPAKTGRSSRYS